MDTVLGVSMAPSTVRMVLMEGEHTFDIPADGDSGPPSAPERVISAILGTREGATEGATS